MALETAYLKKLALTLGDKEATYGAGPAAWTAPGAVSMSEFTDESGYVQWDDLVVADDDTVSGHELATHQEIARQSARLTYTEPRTKPNTVAGLLALVLGTVTTTQDGTETAYRHKITPAAGTALPSIGAQAAMHNGAQYKYHGVKGESFVFAVNGPYFRSQTLLIGSGYRTTAADAFPAIVQEDWLHWGEAKIYLKDTAGTPITLPTNPVQTTANMGGSEIDISTRVMDYTLTWTNNMQTDLGYRAGTGKVRNNFHPTRRTATMNIRLECDTADEATQLAYYLNQSKLAVEMNINSGVLVDPDGTYFYGAILMFPRLQVTQLVRSQVGQFENLELQTRIIEDSTNPALAAWVYNAKTAYLA